MTQPGDATGGRVALAAAQAEPHETRAMSQRATCTPYLYFKGACEQALAFYAEHGLGTVRELRRYDGTPAAERYGEAWRNKVLHSLFEGPGIRFYAGDGPDSEPMKGCANFTDQFGVQWAVNCSQAR
jgi:uncharacterized glyoxalase superfamily protein PhnB